MNLLIAIILGGVAGWIAGELLKGSGFGLLGNVIIGLLGGLVGNLVFGLFGLESSNLLGGMVVAVIGAIILVVFVNMIFGKRGAV